MAAASLSAQDAARWTTLESENKELSVAFPPNFLVDAETHDYNQRQRIVGFQNGVKMELVIYKESNPKQRLGLMRNEKAEWLSMTNFTVKQFSGRNLIYRKNRYVNSLYLASDDFYYSISISASSEQKPEVSRFLLSIKLNNKPLITTAANKTETGAGAAAAESVSVTTLKTSPEVFEALNRKIEKTKGKIDYELETNSAEKELPVQDDEIRPAIILVRERPNFRMSLSGRNFEDQKSKVKIRTRLLANGQIGDMIVYSNADREIISSCIEAVRKSKFIPAGKNNQPIDSEQDFEYSFEVFSSLLR